MALPNLSALRLAEAARRVDTGEWVQYDPELQTVIDNEDLRECPICALEFQKDEWLWKANRGQGRYAYYTPRKYWNALKMRNGVDPMMSDVPVPDEDVRQLVAGPPGAVDHERDLIDDPPSSKEELEALLAQWRAARQGRTVEIQAENREEEAAYERRMQEDDEWFRASLVKVDWGVPSNVWMKRLLKRGLVLDDLEFLFMSTRRGQPNSNFDAQQQLRTSQIVQNLEINNSLMHWARDLTTRHSPTDLHPKLFFHMPFYTDFQVRVADSSYDRPALSHKPGVVYEWRRRMPLGEAFVITANIHPRSHLSKCLAEAVSAVRPDSTDDLFRKVVLRALVGLDAGVETDQLNELARYVNVVRNRIGQLRV